MREMSDPKDKVIVAMSGGVDSSVAAAMLLEQGYDVTGVFVSLGSAATPDSDSHGSCMLQDRADAHRVADTLGIDLHVLDLAEEFEEIIDYFVAEYSRGRTPNPCVHCNTLIKFGKLMRLADSLGTKYVATGHHARIANRSGAPIITRPNARDKDQSYALFAVARENLARILLPIGEVDDKNRVREIARTLNLNVHDKRESQEICFVEDNDYVSLLRERAPQALKGGDIVTSDGEVVGRHDGFARFTIGQRRGLRVAAGIPMYVTSIDPESATVTIGPRDQVMGRYLRTGGANWHCSVSEQFDAIVQVRYNHRGAPGKVRITGERTFEVNFTDDVAAITPGQGAAVYDGDYLLGGGWID